MKNLQEAINNHVMNSRNHKRYLAALIAMSMLVSFMVPFLLIEPAVSLTNDSEISPQAAGAMLTNYANADGNDGYSPKERSEVELLVGNGVEWASDCTTASEVIEKAKEEYFLGIAYDFSLFLEGTATLKNADAEGRVAVGGNLIFTGGYCYQVGSGNFGYMTALKDTDDYQGITNFAHAIVGGYMKNIHPLSTGNNRMRINQLTTEKGGHQGYRETLYFPPTEDMFKRFVVGADINNDDFTHMHCSNEKYNANGSHDSVSVNELAEMYKQPEDGVINFTSTFEWLRERSIKLGEKTATGEATSNGNKVTFKIPDGMENAKTVYFDLPDNVDYSKLEEIRFENVPKDTTEMIVRETETDELKKITKNIPKCNLVINAKGTSFDIRGVGNTTKTIIKYTDNTEDEISNNIDLEKRDEYNKNDIHHNNEISNDNGAVVPCRSNNHPASSKILYNFPNAKTGTINGNFNGTIFAPDANIKSDDSCTGHLSGALIAKSFEGGLEFGYRPYRGTSDILGSNSGYVVPVDKLIKDTETYLPNASFTITDNNTNKIVDRWKSGDATEFVVIPSLVDFSGKINYNTETNQYVKTYTIAESSSPNGYIKTDKNYTVSVTETVNKDYLLKFGEGTIPQVVDVEITINSSDTTETAFPKTIKFQYRDSYDETADGMAQTQRKILVYDGENVSKVFTLNINTVGGSQTVTQLGTIDNWTDNYDVEEIASPQVTEAVSEETTEAVETTTQAIASESETSEEQNNDIPTESAPEIEPVNENANAADEVSGEQSADNAVTQYKKIKPIESTEITPPDGKDLKSSWEFTVDENNRYYYDNNSMMVIPLPDSNLKFENKPGLLFTKVDKTTGEILEKAEISITPEYTGFDASSGSFLFDIENLGTGVYTLTEGNPPPNYEKKYEPIYLQKRDGKLYYGETNPPKTEIVKNDNGYYSFSMEDIKISGAKIKLGKWKSDYSTRLKGAKFQLQASSDKTVVYPLPATVKDTDNNDVPNTFTIPADKDFDLYTTLKNADPSTYDTNYIQNGYLKPGQYTLHEVEAPEGNYQPQDFQFRVKNDNSIEVIPSGTPEYFKAKITDKGSGNGSSGPKQIGIQVINKTDEEISVTNVTKVEIELNSPDNGTIIAYDDGISCPLNNKTTSISNGLAVFDNLNNISLSKFKLQNNSYDIGLDIKEVRIYGEEGSGGGSGSNPSVQSYTINKIQIKSGSKFNVTFYYADKDPVSKPNLGIKDGAIDIDSFDKTNVIGIEITNGDDQTNGKVEWIQETGNGYATIFNTTYGTEYELGLFGEKNSEPTTTSSSESDTPETTTTADNELLDLELDEENGVIKIPNQKPGTNIKITAQKEWANDTGFESLRPESISVTLKRKLPNGTVDNSFNDAKTLTSPDWKAEWSVPRLVDENGADAESNQYKYYVEENVISNSYYDVSYSDNNEPGLSTAGTITITNTLKTKNIPVTKKWLDSEHEITPEGTPNVRVKLQWKDKNSNSEFTDVPGKTLTLSSPNYTGTFENLPENKDYQVIEVSAPPGWKFDKTTGDADTGFTITNVPDYTQLTVKKEWDDGNNANNRPEKIHFKLYRKAQSGGSSGGDVADAPNFNPNLTNKLVPDYTDDKYTSKNITQYNDYARLLQYSLYFYDANMCGSDVSEKSAFSKTNAHGWRDDCHTYSGYVDGGYHDAGDHVMFGLPQGFTASTLGWSYYEFKDSYDTLGLTEHYKTIMKYFCDFFEKSIRIRNNTVEILVQKGDSSTDHDYWGAPETQSNYGSEIWVSDRGGNIAAQYAAALAQYSLNFPDDANSASYLVKAIEFYNFATSHPTDYDVSNYNSKESADDIAWAAGWLYLATGKNNNDYLDKLNSCPNIDWLYNWNNVAMGAACLKAEINGDWSTVNSAIDSNFKNCNAKVGNYICLNDWGSARYSTLMQFVALVSDKNNNTETYKELCQGQMAYLLGDNSIESNGNTSTCFVTGFAPNSAKYPHHRAASGTSEAKTDKTKYQHQLVGALVGGPNTSGKYIDITDNGSELCYQVNEVALDYNAGLVGAAAGLYAAYGTGETYSNVPPAQKSRTKVGPMKLNFNVNVNVLDAATLGDPVATYDGPYSNSGGITIDSPILNVTKIEFQFNNEGYGGFNGYTLNNTYMTTIDKNDNIYTINCDNITFSSLIFNMYGANVTNIKIYTSGSGSTPTPTTTTTTTKKEETPTVTTTTTTADTSGLTAHEYIFNGQTTKDGLGLKHVKKIAIIFDNTVNTNGMLQLNGIYDCDPLPGSTDAGQKGNNKWEIKDNNKFEYGSVDIDVNKFEFNIWGSGDCKTGKVIFYTEPEGIKVTPESAELTEGEEMTITANMAATWEITEGADLIDDIAFTGTEYKFKAKDNVHGTVKITAKADGKSKTATITITGKTITNLPEAVNLHVNKSKKLSPVPADNVSYKSGSEAVATVDNTGNITAKSTGDTVITVSRNGESVNVTVHVLDDLSITGNGIMNKNATQQLTAANAVGAVKWSINPDSNEPKIKIDPDTGVVTSETGTGNATVIATDSDGTTAEFNIIVNLTAVQPDLPEGAVEVQDVGDRGIITLTADGRWQEVLNLPKTDASGHVYEYYIVEVDELGNVIGDANPIKGKDKTNYYPVEYRNNGMTLNDSDKTITVKNEASEKPENPDYTLPNTGGIGTGGFTTAGGAIIIGSTALYILSKRRRKKNVVR